MREYGKVHTVIWQDDDFRGMSEDGRTLFVYLLTCPHGNMLGCFRLADAYAAEDLKWESERVRKGFDELFANRFTYRCDTSFWVFIRKYLMWNQFENPNVATAAGKMFEKLNCPDVVKALLAGALREFAPKFKKSVLDDFEGQIEPFDNPFKLSSKTRARATAVATTGALAATEAGANPAVEQTPLDPVKTIFAYWQKKMSSPKSAMDEKRKSLIVKALKNYEPADICKAIRGCSRTPHNMGQNDRNTKYNGLNLILRDAEHIDYFINLNDSGARPAAETIEQMNARLAAEFLGDSQGDDDMTLEMES